MRQAFFLTGFNNWGKSSLIFDLFSNQRRFRQGSTYRITGVNLTTAFTVQSQSNDDLGPNYVRVIRERINNAPDGGENLFSALCPSLEQNNSFVTILSNPPFDAYDRLHLFLIEYKWEHHARLLIDNIIESARQISKISFIIINAEENLVNDNDRYNAKLAQIQSELSTIFGTP